MKIINISHHILSVIQCYREMYIKHKSKVFVLWIQFYFVLHVNVSQLYDHGFFLCLFVYIGSHYKFCRERPGF